MSDELTPTGQNPASDETPAAPEAPAEPAAAASAPAAEGTVPAAESAVPAAEGTVPAAEGTVPAAPAAEAPTAPSAPAASAAPSAPAAPETPAPAEREERRGPSAYQESEGGGRNSRIGSGVKPADVDYKNIALLSRFLDRRGRILSRRKTRVTAKVQRRVAQAIKRARHLALLPYTADQTRVVRKRR